MIFRSFAGWPLLFFLGFGAPTFAVSKSESKVAFMEFPPTQSLAFEENSHRYFSPKDLQHNLQDLFPLKNESFEDPCNVDSPAYSSVVGAINPATGEPASPLPTGIFVNWLSQCLTSRFETWAAEQEKALSPVEFQNLVLGPGAVERMRTYKLNIAEPLVKISTQELRLLELDVIDHWTRQMIGPQVIVEDFGYVSSYAEFKETVAAGLSFPPENVFQIARQAVLFIGLRDEFLTY